MNIVATVAPGTKKELPTTTKYNQTITGRIQITAIRVVISE